MKGAQRSEVSSLLDAQIWSYHGRLLDGYDGL